MKEYLDLNDYELMYMISENDEDAKEIMFKKYQPIVYKFAKKYYQIGKNYGLELDDVIQEGYVGLYIAINNYKEDKNCLFYTYASITIASKLKNLIKTHSTNKHLALNNYISLNSYVDNEECDSELVDFIEDSKEVLPDVEAEIQDFYNKIKHTHF